MSSQVKVYKPSLFTLAYRRELEREAQSALEKLEKHGRIDIENIAQEQHYQEALEALKRATDEVAKASWDKITASKREFHLQLNYYSLVTLTAKVTEKNAQRYCKGFLNYARFLREYKYPQLFVYPPVELVVLWIHIRIEHYLEGRDSLAAIKYHKSGLSKLNQHFVNSGKIPENPFNNKRVQDLLGRANQKDRYHLTGKSLKNPHLKVIRDQAIRTVKRIGFSVSELNALTVEDIRPHIPNRRADFHIGVVGDLNRMRWYMLADCLEVKEWRDAGRIKTGLLFRHVHQGKVSDKSLSKRQLKRILNPK